MDYPRFLRLHQDYCADTSSLSFIKYNHPAYQELLQAGEEIVPWLLQRLQDTIGHDSGQSFDYTNSPWLSIVLLANIMRNAHPNSGGLHDMPKEYAGYLDKVREYTLVWGRRRAEPIVGVPIIVIE